LRVAAEPPAPALSRTGLILKAAEPSLAADLLELTKPRIAVMALITVAAGYLLGAAGDFHALTLLNTLLGAGLVAAGGAALNHTLERRPDARMHRTARRPLPSGRVRPAVALAFGGTLFVAGVAWLAWTLPDSGAAIAAAATGLLYVAVYTPM
jgi:protoheme IX farnesyltransferase